MFYKNGEFDQVGLAAAILLFVGIIMMSIYFSGALSGYWEQVFFYGGLVFLGFSLGYIFTVRLV